MMQSKEMLRTHPQKAGSDMGELSRCIDECFSCAQTCTACADACLSEQMVQELRRCIRLNLDCADVCQATGRILSRQTEMDWSLAQRVLAACAQSCRVCGQECRKHAAMHEHCRVCADACQRCEQACTAMMETIKA